MDLMKRYLVFIVCSFIVYFTQPVFAFDDVDTHPKITEKSVEQSNINDFLANQLGRTNTEEKLEIPGEGRYPIFRLLTRGSELEDTPMCRAANHFHNPLKDWTSSGLTDESFVKADLWCLLSPFSGNKYSNLVWATGMQNSFQVPYAPPVNNDLEINNGRNWSVARAQFYDALTQTDNQIREMHLARTFETLGYILHLLQDMAVPAHTRNDFSQGHYRWISIPEPDGDYSPLDWWGNPFEGFVRDNFNKITQQTQGQVVRYEGENKLTNFWDTDAIQDGVTPTNFDGRNLGLSEYSNLNFISNSTIFKSESDTEHYFKYPSRESIIDPYYPDKINIKLYDDLLAEDGNLDTGIYVTKEAGEGHKIEKFLSLRYVAVDKTGGADGPEWAENVYYLRFKLDDPCFLEYATRLIPRAVGYSAGLIDYFFRGRLDVQVDKLTYGSDSTVIKAEFLVRNMTPATVSAQDVEQIENGALDIVYSYTTPGNSIKTYQLVENVYSILNGGDLINSHYVPITAQVNIPAGAADISFMVVFQGKLGDEYDAVAAQIYELNNSRIAYGYQPGGQPNTSNIFSISSDGSFPYQVTNASEPNPWYFSPTWSLDGTMMAFEKERCTDPNLNPNDPFCSAEFHIRDIVGIDLLSELKYPDNVLFERNFNGDSVANASFSPDGTMVAALKRNESGRYYYGSLVVFDLANNSKWIVNGDDNPEITNLFGSTPSWSPTGDKIAYYLNSQYDEASGTMKFEGDLFLIDPFNSQKIRLTNDDFNNTQPSWSPDGERIVFSSDRDGEASMDIWLMDRNGANLTRLVDCTPASCYSPTFSPDGQNVAFSNGSTIYSVNIDGDPYSLKEVAHPGQYISGITWSSTLVPPSFLNVQLEPAAIVAGGSTVLSWQTDRATEVLIQGIAGEQPVNGSIVLSPMSTTIYILTANGPTGTTQTAVTVAVE